MVPERACRSRGKPPMNSGLALLLVVIGLGSTQALDLAKVVGVSDGDTITVLQDLQQTVIRLHGIDCPEGGADFSNRAKQFTSALVFGKEVRVVPVEIDRYGRTVARVYIDGKDVSLELVRAGWAWHFVRYAPNDRELAQAEAEARAEKRGLWVMPNPVPPWGPSTTDGLHASRSPQNHSLAASSISSLESLEEDRTYPYLSAKTDRRMHTW